MEPRHGWRKFECECGYKWAEATRDRFSPSGEDCSKCGDWCVPCESWEDPALKVDSCGNLVTQKIR